MIKNPYEGNAVPTTNPRHIQVRRTAQPTKSGLIQLTVNTEVQDFFAQLMNKIGKRSDWFATCVTCVNWQSYTANKGDVKQCVRFGVIPPPEVIADGCEHYEDEDQIPF